jgi:hypothetical protein
MAGTTCLTPTASILRHVYFIKIRWIPGLAAFALIGAGIHALWANAYAYLIAIPLGVLIGWGFWAIVDPIADRRHLVQASRPQCDHCGKPFRVGDEYCKRCGRALAD